MMDTEVFQSELLGNESLLWQGKPERSVIFHKGDALAIPFSLMWGGFAIFWTMGALGLLGASSDKHDNPATWFFAAWGIPFVLIGQYMIWGRFIYTYWKKSRTYYAVTSKRILIRNVQWSGSAVRSLDLSSLGEIQKSIRSSGIGTVQFGNPATLGRRRNRMNGFDPLENNGIPAFVDILDAGVVYDVMMEAKEKLNNGQASQPAFGFSRGN